MDEEHFDFGLYPTVKITPKQALDMFGQTRRGDDAPRRITVSDMGDTYREMREHEQARRRRNLAAADSTGWTKITPYYWSRRINGMRLDYWPSTKKFQYAGRVMTGDVTKFIASRHRNEDDSFEWQQIAKRTTVDVEEATLKPIFYLGSIQGRLGTWFKESDFIYVRDSVFGVLVRCNYRPSMYDTIYRCYRDKKAVIHVTGRIKSDRLSGNPKEISVDNIERYDPLSDEEFSGIFGSVPLLSGSEGVGDFLDRMRDDAE